MTTAKPTDENTTAAPAVGIPINRRVVPLVARLRAAGAAEDLVGLLVEYEGSAIADAAKRRINMLTEAASVIEKLAAAVEWYADEARACARNSGTARHDAPHALLASVTVLALDGGRRADDALRHNTKMTGA